MKLKDLNGSKGRGPDSVPPFVLKNCANILAPTLTTLFNKFMQVGIFPEIFKLGFIVPIHKSNNPSVAVNLQPVILLSSLSEVSKTLVLNQLVSATIRIFASEQHGFRAGRSTVSNLVRAESSNQYIVGIRERHSG